MAKIALMTRAAVVAGIWLAIGTCALLGAGAIAQAASSEAVATQRVHHLLQPGWNFVGWLGEDGSADDLFEQVDEIAAVYAQAATGTSAQTLAWEPVGRGSGRIIRSGEALWIRIAAERSVRWFQDALREMPESRLHTGQNAVVWAWAGYRPVAAVLGRVAKELQYALRWNRYTQEFERYSPEFSSRDLLGFGISRGEALLVEMGAPGIWGPPHGPVIAGADWLSEHDRTTVERTAQEVHEYFDTWLGTTPVGFEIYTREFSLPCVSGGGGYRLVLYLPCDHLRQLAGALIAERYADAVVLKHRDRPPDEEPDWLLVGHANYTYRRWVSEAGIRPYETAKAVMIGYARSTDLAVDSEILADRSLNPDRPAWQSSREILEREITTLAIDWLVERSSPAALKQYGRERFGGDWRNSFEHAFGMSVQEMLTGFATYRTELRHGHGRPIRLSRPFHHIVFFGPMTDDRWDLVEDVEAVIGFFERRFGFVASSVLFVLDFDRASYEHFRGTVGVSFCGDALDSRIFVVDECLSTRVIAHEYAHVFQYELMAGARGSRPSWVFEGSADYFGNEAAVELPDGDDDPGGVWTWYESAAATTIRHASATASDAEAGRVALERAPYVTGAVAVRWLVQRYGIEKVLEIFGPTWTNGGRDDASRFQAVFDVSLDDFYAEFGGWLRSLL